MQRTQPELALGKIMHDRHGLLPNILMDHFSHVWLFPGAEGGKWLEQRIKDHTMAAKDELQIIGTAENSVPDVRQAKRLKI